MIALLVFLHLIGAIVWMGGMAFILAALRPAAFASLQPPQRPQLLLAALRRFFPWVWISIVLLLGSGLAILLPVGMDHAPVGWHVMLAIGLVMMAVFAHIYFAPFARARRAAAAGDWAAVARALQQAHPLVVLNFVLGWLAIAAALFWR